jgi:TRAP-type C4-dicarboxylate transport system permease small subunit
MIKKNIGAIVNTLMSICSGFEKFGSYVLVGMVILTSTDIFLRRAFNSPFPFTYELVEFMLVLVAYSYVPFTTSLARHVSMDTLTMHLPAATRKRILLAGDILTIILFALISWQNVLQGINVLHQGATTAILHVPKFPFQFMVALGSALACLVFLSKIIKSQLGGEPK